MRKSNTVAATAKPTRSLVRVSQALLLALFTLSYPINAANNFDASVQACSLIQTRKIAIAGSFSYQEDGDGHLCSRNKTNFTPAKLETSCPESCPFSQRLAGDHCHKVCIRSELCRVFHPLRSFADHESMECVPTCGKRERDHVAGCAVCAGVGQCKTCVGGFHLDKDGHCVDNLSGFWKVVYCVLAFVAALLALYFFSLSQRPTINHDVLHQALEHRHEGKVWQRREDDLWHHHKIMNTSVHSTDISGQGVLLYFSFLNFAMLMATVLLAGAFITYRFSSLAMQTDGITEHCDAARSILGRDGVRQKDAYRSYDYRMFLGMVTIYTTVLICSLIHVWHQTNTSYRWDESHATHEDYALRVEGLPKDACDPSELKDFFTSALKTALGQQEPSNPSCTTSSFDHPAKIVGVSIAYDYKDHENFIEDCIDDWITDLEMDMGRRNWKHRPLDKLDEHVSTVAESTKPFSRSEIFKLRFLDYIFWGSCGDEYNDTEVDSERCQQVLRSLKCSGTAYVIGSTPEVVDLLHPFFKHSDSAPFFRGTHKIRLRQVFSEPMSLYWANFTEMNFWPRILLGMFVTLSTIVLWLCLYLPYALSYIHTMRVPGKRPSFLEENVLGLLIALGNAIVAKVVDIVTSWAGFKQKDRRDMAVMSLALLATLLNTGCDIWMAVKIAHGAELSDAFEETMPAYDRVVARELMSIIVPGYLIVPYVVSPLFEHVVPYFLGSWLVRSKKASVRQAEKFLESPEFDICWRYSDVLNNFTICLLMLTFASSNSYKVMCWLLAFLILIYGIDKFKLLRETSQTFYTTRRLEDTAQFWWGLPSGVLAGITVQWACSAHVQMLPQEKAGLFSVLGFLAHIVLYVALCRLVRLSVPRQESETTTYHQMCEQLKAEGKVWSYFNTNPIFCLRSKYLEAIEPGVDVYPCVPFVPGKQFLQQGVPKQFKHSDWGVLKSAKKIVSSFVPVTPKRAGTPNPTTPSRGTLLDGGEPNNRLRPPRAG